MEILSPLLENVKGLLALASKHLGYIYNLKDNVDLLQENIEVLKAASDYVKARVEREEEETRAQCTNQVASWLGKVQVFFGGVDRVHQEDGERDQIKCLSRCLPQNCWSSYKLGKRVDQLLNEARQLQHEKEQFSDFTSPPPPPQVLEMPMDKIVGLDISLDKVWKWLVKEKQVGVIGLYGTGGVGKTTLMKRINEKLLHTNHEFKVVIWVGVSKQVDEDCIRDAIRKRLHIQDESWDQWSREEKVDHLCHVLTRKKFVLLIDDVWQRLDLSNIGVPLRSLENGSKVVFTTRDEQVCHQMEANKTFKVQCLIPKDALKLFEKNVGKSLMDCDQEIRDLAEHIAKECKGLPLALITVGRAMAGKHSRHEWKHALRTLRNRPHELQGMVDKVYRILEFSYDSLYGSTQKDCFRYCCLFPEDYPIITNHLIELWIGEGLLGDIDGVYGMRDKGESVLGDLKRACLLESGRDGDRQYVKMHDVIRDMATWIAHDHGQTENRWRVIEKDEDMSAEMISKWGEAKKVSIWGKGIRNIDKTPPQCSRLETLFVRRTEVMVMPKGFFDSMKACLTILDLSDNKNIQSFPEDICNLINLQFLNLSGTRIRKLPGEIKNLIRLRWLLLDNMSEGILIPIRAITSLPLLNVFSHYGSFLIPDQVKEEEMVEELGCMHPLSDLSIYVRESSSAQKIFQSPDLRKRIRRACINNRNLTSIVISYSRADNNNFLHLEMLHLSWCIKLCEMKITEGIGRAANCYCFPNLVKVRVTNCKLSDLSWLVHAPELRVLTVEDCYSMERIIGDGIAREELVASGLFSRLESLQLARLPKLKSICDQALYFPQGVCLVISNCPGIRKLPLDSSSARGSFEVRGDKRWWAEFEWDPTARVTLQLHREAGPAKEMTFGEIARKMKNGELGPLTTVRFLSHGPSE